jgi:hypothetical protein
MRMASSTIPPDTATSHRAVKRAVTRKPIPTADPAQEAQQGRLDPAVPLEGRLDRVGHLSHYVHVVHYNTLTVKVTW